MAGSSGRAADASLHNMSGSNSRSSTAVEEDMITQEHDSLEGITRREVTDIRQMIDSIKKDLLPLKQHFEKKVTIETSNVNMNVNEQVSNEESSNNRSVQDRLSQVMTASDLRLRHEKWTKEEKVFARRVEQKEENLRSTKAEIYQLLGLYFLFQGVIITAVTKANIGCKLSWIPIALSAIVSIVTIIGVVNKLKDKYKLKCKIQQDRACRQAAYDSIEKLETEGKNFDYTNHKIEANVQGSIWAEMLPSLLFPIVLLGFSPLVGVSCHLILCR